MNHYDGTHGVHGRVQISALHMLALAWTKAWGEENEADPAAGRIRTLVITLICAVPLALLIIPALTF